LKKMAKNDGNSRVMSNSYPISALTTTNGPAITSNIYNSRPTRMPPPTLKYLRGDHAPEFMGGRISSPLPRRFWICRVPFSTSRARLTRAGDSAQNIYRYCHGVVTASGKPQSNTKTRAKIILLTKQTNWWLTRQSNSYSSLPPGESGTAALTEPKDFAISTD
jgi:hypothetical protein